MKDPSKINWAQIKKELDDDRQKRNFKPSTTGTGKELPTVSVNAQKEPLSMPVYKEITQKYVDEKGVPFVSAPEDLPKLYQYGDRTNNPEMLKDYQRAVDEMRGAFGDDKTYSMLNIPNKPLDAKDTKQSDYASNMQNIGDALENSSLVNPVGTMVRGGAEGIKKGIETIGKTLSTPPEGFTKEQMIGNKGIGLTAGLTETALGIVSAVTPGIMAITEGTQLISEFGGKDVVEAVMTPVTKFTNPQTDTEKNLAMLGDLTANALLMKGIHKGVKTFKGEAPVEIPKEITPETPKVEAPKVDYLGEYESVNKQMAILDNKVKMNSNLLKEAKGSQRKKLSKEIESAQNEKVLLDLRQSELRQQLQEQGVLKTVDPVKDNTAEFKGGTSPVKVIGEDIKPSEIITNENKPSQVELSPKEIKDVVNGYDQKLREAEQSGNEALYNKLVEERKPWLDKLETGKKIETLDSKIQLNNNLIKLTKDPVKQENLKQKVKALVEEKKTLQKPKETKQVETEPKSSDALKQQLTDLRDQYNEGKGQQKTQALKEAVKVKGELEMALSREGGGKVTVENKNGNLKIQVDGKSLKKDATFRKPEEYPIMEENAKVKFEDMADKGEGQLAAVEALNENGLIGDISPLTEGKTKKALEDIREDGGRELSVEAQVLRQAVEKATKEGVEVSVTKNKGTQAKAFVTPDEIQALKDAKIEERAKVNEGGDTSFEFGENIKDEDREISSEQAYQNQIAKYGQDNLTPGKMEGAGETISLTHFTNLKNVPGLKSKGFQRLPYEDELRNYNDSTFDGANYFSPRGDSYWDQGSYLRMPDYEVEVGASIPNKGVVKITTFKGIQELSDKYGGSAEGSYFSPKAIDNMLADGIKVIDIVNPDVTGGREIIALDHKGIKIESIKPKKTTSDFELTSGEKEIAPKPKSEFGEQMSLGGETIKTQMPDKPLYEGKADKSGETPLFQQEAEVKGQEKMFDAKEALTENRIISDEAYEKAKANIIRKSSQLNAGVDPTLIKDYAVAGAYHLENIVRSGIKKNQQLAVWVKKMTDQYGEGIKPQLLSIWNDINKNTPELSTVAGNSFNFTAKTTLNEQDYNKYINFRKEQESFSGHLKDTANKLKDYGESGSGIISKALESKDRVIEKISSKLYRKLVEHDQKTELLTMNRMKSLEGFFKGVQKFSKEDKYRLELAMFNSDGKMLTELFKKYNMEGEHAQLRQTLNELAETSGIKPGEFYFPRAIKNYAEFLKQFQDLQNRNIFDKLIEDHERKFGKMTDEQKFHLIDNTLRGYNKGITLSKIGNEKARVIRILDSNLAQNYYDPFTSLSKYIFEMTEMQEARKFFGKIADGNSKSIGELTLEMIKNEKLDYNNANKLVEVLNARFQPKRSPKFITSVKKVIYIEKLGQVTSALTQLKDLSTSLYRNGALATTKALYEVITNKKAVGVEDIGIMQDKIAQELSDPSKLNAILDNTMKYAGFTKLDVLGKETFINGYMKRFKGEALKDSKILHERLDKLFDANEKAQVIEDLKAGKKSDNVKLLLFSELSRTQPISKSALPVGYDTSPIGRILYTFRTFAIRRLNFWMDETVREFKTNKPQAIKNTLRLATYAGLMGASVDAVTNILLGRKMSKEDMESTLLYNTLDVLTVNKYLISQFGQRQFSDAMSSLLRVPVPLVDNVYADIRNLAKTGKFKGHVLKSVPVVGRIAYDRLNKK